MPRKEFRMSEEQHATLLEACKPVPCMKIGSYVPRSPQANANAAWDQLGREMGFDTSTVSPVDGKDSRSFMAVSTG